MKYFVSVLIFITLANGISAQYYEVPAWFSDFPLSDEASVYAIGISDPRMSDTVLAANIAVHRAVCVAALLHSSKVMYASDYFETKSEEHRTFILTETYQELAKIEARMSSKEVNNYKVLKQERNQNDETIVLIVWYPDSDKEESMVYAEYFRQDFELSNTRSLESIRSLMLGYRRSVESDRIFSKFKAIHINNDISFEIEFDSIEIRPPGYFYDYRGVSYESLNLNAFNSSTKLEKGLWNAFVEALLNSMIRKTKNFKSQMELVNDIYSTAQDNTPDNATGSLARQVSRNNMQFRIGSICIDDRNMMHLSLLYPYESKKVTFAQGMAQDSVELYKPEKKKNIFYRLFRKREK